MATLDDKLLGEKLQYYCSSSEDEGPRGDDKDGDEEVVNRHRVAKPPEGDTAKRRIKSSRYDLRHSSNTGPKGVLKDYQRQKHAEEQQRGFSGKERHAKVTQTGDIPLVDIDQELSAAADQALQQILDDRRELAVSQKHQAQPHLSGLIALKNGEDMLEAIDKEPAHVTVVILIHEGQFYGAAPFLAGLNRVSHAYPTIKCCEISAPLLGDKLTAEFRRRALPTLQVYRQGHLCGNFLRIADECKCTDNGSSSIADLEEFLNEKGLLEQHERKVAS